MNTISAEKLVTGYGEVQRVIARAGAYSLVLRKKKSRSDVMRHTPGKRLPMLPECRAEKTLLALLAFVAMCSIAVAWVGSLELAGHWEAFQNGITTLLK